MYQCKYFKIQELVDKATFDARGEKAWELLDEKALIGIDKYKECVAQEYKVLVTDVSVTINNWNIGGILDESGLRDPNTATGSKFSQHKFGRAFDCKTKIKTTKKVLTGEEMRAVARKYKDQIGCTCLETGTDTWLHLDFRNCKPLLEVPFK